MASIDELKARANKIIGAFLPESVTNEEVGKLILDVIDYFNEGISTNPGTGDPGENYWSKKELEYLNGYLYAIGSKIKAGESDNSQKWFGYEFDNYIDQPVRTSDNVEFNDIHANSIQSKEFASLLKGWLIAVNGDAQLRDLFIKSLATFNFSAGPLGAGVGIINQDELQTDYLLVRKIMYVLEMMVQRMRFQGGIQVLSPAAGFKISRVEETDTYYRCYFEDNDGEIPNEFVVNDFARLQNYTGNSQKYLWGLVITSESNYIDISKTDKDGNGVPAAGDELVQLGNLDDTSRQDAVLLSAVNGEVGIFTYFGINSFSLSGREGSWLGKHAGKVGAFIKGEFHFSSGENVQTELNKVDQKADSAQSDLNDYRNATNATLEILNAVTDDLQSQVDGTIMAWDGSEAPTLNNYPASEWTTDEEKARHKGDYYDRFFMQDGKKVTERYKFTYENNAYQWTQIADSSSALALQEAREALGLAGTKAKLFYGDSVPTAPYDINDAWWKTNGSILMSAAKRLEGYGQNAADWQVVNDTQVRLAQMASDNVISKEEKASLRNDKAQIDKEYSKYQSDATKYGVSITALQAAYNALVAFLNNTVKISQDTDFTFSGLAQQAQYNQLFADYYAARTDFANIIAGKISKDSIDKFQPGDTNLLDGSNKGWKNSYYLIATISLGDYKPKEGEECTIVMKGKLGEGKSAFGIYNSGGSITLVGIYSSNFNSDGIAKKTFKWVVGGVNSYLNIYTIPSSVAVESEIEWVKLVSGNKTSLLWTPSLNDQKQIASEEAGKVVDKLEIGGVNILNNSGNFGDTIKNWYNNGGGMTVDSAVKYNGYNTIKTAVGPGILGDWYKLENGVEYCYSAMIKSDAGFVGGSITPLHFQSGYGNSNESGKYEILDFKQSAIANEWTLLHITFKLTQNADSFRPFIYWSSTAIGNFNIAFLCLARGNKPMVEWSPSLKDQGENIQGAIDNTHIGSQNLISRKMMLAWNNVNPDIVKWGQGTNGVCMSIRHNLLYQYIAGELAAKDIFAGAIKFKNNTQYVFSVEWKVSANNANGGIYFLFYYTDGTIHEVNLPGNQTTITRVDYITDPGKTVSKISSTYGTAGIQSLIYNISLIEGNKPLQGFPVAEEDQTGASNVNYLDNGNFTFEKEGYALNQDVALTLSNNILQARSSQTGSTPGVWLPKMNLKAGVYTLNVKIKGVNNPHLIYDIYTADHATEIYQVYKDVTANLSIYNIQFAIPADGEYVALIMWTAPASTAYPAGFDLEWVTFTPGMIGSTAFFPSQNDIDKNVDQEANKGKLYLRGTGYNRDVPRILILNNDGINRAGNTRGLNLTIINRDTLAIVDSITYDTYTQTGVDALTDKLNGIANNVIVCLISRDISFSTNNNTNLLTALKRCGSSGSTDMVQGRLPYAFVGIPDIGEGMGLEVFTATGANAPYAEISTQIINGIPQGVNASIFTKVVRSELHGEVVATQDVFKAAYNEQDWNVLGDKIAEYNSTITQTARDLSITQTSVNILTGQVTQLGIDLNGVSGQLSLFAKKDDLFSGITIKPELIKITGQTLFKDSNNNEVAMFKNGKVINVNNGVFSVDNTGRLVCTNADISGKITANSGEIAGMKISNNGIKSADFNPSTKTGSCYAKDGFSVYASGTGVLIPSSGLLQAGIITAMGNNADITGLEIIAKNTSSSAFTSTVTALRISAINSYNGDPINRPVAIEVKAGITKLYDVEVASVMNIKSYTVYLKGLPQRSGSGNWRALVMNLDNRRMYWQ